MTRTEKAVNLVDRLFNVSTILIISACVSALGTVVNLVRAALGTRIHFGYVSLLAVIAVTAVVALWLASRGDEKDALTAYAWIAGSAFGGMVFIDCYRGEAWEHLYWLYLFGIFSLVFLVSIKRALLFAIACIGLGLITGIIRKSVSGALGLGVLPVAIWAMSAHIKVKLIELEKLKGCLRAYLDGREEKRAQ